MNQHHQRIERLMAHLAAVLPSPTEASAPSRCASTTTTATCVRTLSFHALNLLSGRPADGLAVTLQQQNQSQSSSNDNSNWCKVTEQTTNSNGRVNLLHHCFFGFI
jgi:hypothetical protein